MRRNLNMNIKKKNKILGIIGVISLCIIGITCLAMFCFEAYLAFSIVRSAL